MFDNGYSVIVKRDYGKDNGELNFVNFVEDLHEEIIDQVTGLLERFENEMQASKRKQGGMKIAQMSQHSADKLSSSQNTSLLTPTIIKQLVLASNAPEYIFIYLKDAIYAIL